jgi:hypothetical protein
MALLSGAKLGPYEIQSPLGAGGMGEVYRARDTRLDRIVAVKILSTHLSDNPEIKQRFEREARTISSLNHANICQLYDIGSQNGTDSLVMEFLEAYWNAWSQDGKRLYFANGNKLFAAAIPDPNTMDFSNTETVTTLDGVLPVAVTPDGRLLALKPVSGGKTEPMHLVLHFPEMIEK